MFILFNVCQYFMYFILSAFIYHLLFPMHSKKWFISLKKKVKVSSITQSPSLQDKYHNKRVLLINSWAKSFTFSLPFHVLNYPPDYVEVKSNSIVNQEYHPKIVQIYIITTILMLKISPLKSPHKVED